MFGCENKFLERAHLTKIKTGSNLSKEWRWSAYCFGLREIAPIVLSLLYLYGTVSHLYGIVFSYLYGTVRCSLIFNHGKTSPAHVKRQHACLEVHIQQIINLGKKCCIAAHLDEGSSQIAFCTFVDRGNLQLFVWCAHENSISATQDQNDQRLLYLTFVLQIDHV